MPKTATKRPLSDAEKAKKRKEALDILDYPSRALAQGKALYGAGKGIVTEGLGSLIAGAEYAGDRSVTKDVPKDINRLGKMVVQNAGGYADAGNALWQMVKGDGKQAVPDYYRNKAGQAYQEQFNPSPADPRLERFGNFYADPLAVGFGTGRAARGLADPKLYRQIAEDMAKGARSNAIENLWHGSPHTFDRFDLSKIGTGEGAQAYGHGAYLAESPEIGKEYANRLSNKFLRFKDGGLSQALPYSGEHIALNAIDESGGNVDAALAVIQKEMADAGNPKAYEKAITTIDRIKSGDVSPVFTGNLYQTRLAWPDAREATDPLSPDHFLHWDKPLSEQPEVVRNALFRDIDSAIEMTQESIKTASPRSAPVKQKNLDELIRERNRLASLPGESYYNQLSLGEKSGQPIGANQLLDLGIPGIRYLDGGSRGAGAGSHNYVVFDDKLIDIVSRNGQPVGNLGKMVAPQDEALRVAQANAAKPVSEGGLGLRPDNTPEERAAAMGFDTPAFHATRSQKPFDEFRAGKWGSTYLAAGPNRAMNGAAAGATDLSHLYAATDGADVQATAVMPLMVRGNDIATLRPPKDIWDKLPEVTSGDDVDALAKSVGGNYWWDVYDEVPIRSSNGDVIGEQYVKKQFPSNEYGPHSTPWQASDNMLPGYNSASDVDSLAKVERMGQKGFLVSDEAGSSIVAGQNMPIRSRFAAFDPMRRGSNDIMAGLAPFGAVPWLRDEQP